MILFLDTETYSETPITYGTYRYVADCELLIVTWAVDDGEVLAWDVTLDPSIPDELIFALMECDQIVAHNAMFDRNVLNRHLPDYSPELTRWRCAMVRALAHSLPGSLDKLCAVFGIGEEDAKIKEGRQLVQLFCKPRPVNSKLRRATRETHPAEWQRFIEYAKSDIRAMRTLWNKMPGWNYGGNSEVAMREVGYWHADQIINDRGMQVDVELAEAAVRAVAKAQKGLTAEIQDLTGYDGEQGVERATKRDELLGYILLEYGITLPDLQKDTLERRINDPELSDSVKELLRIRLQATTTSTSKYKALLRGKSDDDRLRGTLQFCGASRTGRSAGRAYQPSNLPSRGLLKPAQIEGGIEFLKADCAEVMFDNIMKLTASTIRGSIIAPKGKKLVISDWSNIEGRLAAWLAGEDWKLQAFREFDVLQTADGNWIENDDLVARRLRGEHIELALDEKGEEIHRGPDLYKLAYARAFGIEHTEVVKHQRDIGKVKELMLGYQGGVGAYLTGAATYRIDLEDMAKKVKEAAPDDVWKESSEFYDWWVKQKKGTFGLSAFVFTACDVCKRLWRYSNPRIASYWKELEEGVRGAIANPGSEFKILRIRAIREGNWLRVILPSGRALSYPSPRLDEKGGISYMGINQYTRKWERIKTSGGKILENCIAQGTLVLCGRGWVPIEAVSESDHIWDGEEWVRHSGLSYRGKSFTMTVFGVEMTPEHLVLTTEGWKHGGSCEGHNWFRSRLPDGYTVPRVRAGKSILGIPVSMRKNRSERRKRYNETAEKRNRIFLRVHAVGDGREEEHEARHVHASSVCRMAVDERQVQAPDASGMAKLRRKGDSGLRKMAGTIRQFLGGYGRYVPEGIFPGAIGQLKRLFSRELCLAHSSPAIEQQTNHTVRRYAEWPHVSVRSGGFLRSQEDHLPVPTSPRENCSGSTRPVYDILNCGPRNRFVVWSNDGHPLVVHNCCQAIGRDILYHNLEANEGTGYDTILHVYDEIVAEAPDAPEYNADMLSALMSRELPWTKGLPLAAAGFEAYRYRKG